MITTVIGSYPVSPSRRELASGYFGAMEDPYLGSIERSVRAQVEAGIDLVSDGQTRDNMINIFAKRLGGTRVHGTPRVIDEVRFVGPITLDDQLHARRFLPDGGRIKGIITGPFTMAMSCTDEFYGSMEKLAYAFADALNHEARALEPEVDAIQVDEPFLSHEYPEYARDVVERVFEGVRVQRMLHVCGDVSGIFERLAEFDVDVLEHEFAANPGLLDTVSEVDFRQTLGLGSVRSDKVEVESVEQITAHIQRAVDIFGPDRLIVSPDCGLRHMPRDAAFSKLRNLVQARDMVIG